MKKLRKSVLLKRAMLLEKQMAVGGGLVKKKAYLMFLMNTRDAEFKLKEQGKNVVFKSIEEIRAEFERLHGSIYFF